MQIRPLFDRVLVKRVEEQSRSTGGLFLPETAKEKPSEGIVLAVGAGDGERPLQVAVGDRVVFGRFAGTKVEVQGEERLILSEEEVLGIIEA